MYLMKMSYLFLLVRKGRVKNETKNENVNQCPIS